MILRSEITPIGKFGKPHGLKGEIGLSFLYDGIDLSDIQFVICEIEGIYVPFRIEEYRITGIETALITMSGISTADQAKILSNKEVYLPKNDFVNNDNSDDWPMFSGFIMIDAVQGTVGIVKTIDDSTINTLFVIEKGQEELLIPAVEEFIEKIDIENKSIYVKLPEGLIEH